MRKRSPRRSGVAIGVAIVGGLTVAAYLLARRRSPARNPLPIARTRGLPRPIRRVPPRLTVLDGGAQPQTALAVRGSFEVPDPFELLLQQLFDAEPRDGAFYQIQPGDTPETIARAVLHRVGRFTKQNVLDYIHCFSSSRHNLDRYGSPSTSRSYPVRWLVPAFGQGLRAAFLPRNADALVAIAHRRFPARTTDPKTAAALGPDDGLGVLWLPPVSASSLSQGIVTCSHRAWSDGSSSIEPPPEFLSYLEAA